MNHSKYFILLLLFFICKQAFAYNNKTDTLWLEFPGLSLKKPLLERGIDSLVLKYDLQKENDRIYLIRINSDSSVFICLMPKYVIEEFDIAGFFRIKEQLFMVQKENVSLFFSRTEYAEYFYIKREWMKVNGKFHRWDTFGTEEFFPSWTLSCKEDRIVLIEESFIP